MHHLGLRQRKQLQIAIFLEFIQTLLEHDDKPWLIIEFFCYVTIWNYGLKCFIKIYTRSIVMLVTNSHGPNYLIFWKFIMNSKTCNTYLLFVIFAKFWWISRCVYPILNTFVKNRRNLWLLPIFWQFEYPYYWNGRTFGTLST